MSVVCHASPDRREEQLTEGRKVGVVTIRIVLHLASCRMSAWRQWRIKVSQRHSRRSCPPDHLCDPMTVHQRHLLRLTLPIMLCVIQDAVYEVYE